MPSSSKSSRSKSSGTSSKSGSSTSGNALSSKDVDMMVDHMNTEALAYKKCSVYANYFMDGPLKDMANRAAKHHKQHFDALEKFLNEQS